MSLTLLGQELQCIEKYPYNNGRCGNMILDGCGGITYEEAALLLCQQENPLMIATGIWGVARCMPVRPLTASLQRHLSLQRERLFAALPPKIVHRLRSAPLDKDDDIARFEVALHIEALRLNPDHALSYCGLSFLLRPTEVVALGHVQTPLSRRDLCLEAIRLYPTCSTLYGNLASMISSTETAFIDGEEFTREKLCLKAITLGPNRGASYYNLACVKAKLTITLPDPDGRTLDAMQLYIEALRWEPTHANSYRMLSVYMKARKLSTVTLADGRCLTLEQMLVQHILNCVDDRERALANMNCEDRARCCWSVSCHTAFGPLLNKTVAVLLMGLRRWEQCGSVVCMDPAVLEEMFLQWTLEDSFQLCKIVV